MNGIRFARGDDDEHIIASPEKELSSMANGDASDDRSISSVGTLSITDHDVVSDGGLLAACGSRSSNDLASRSHICHGISLQDITSSAGQLHFSSRRVAVPLVALSMESTPYSDVVISPTGSHIEATLMRLGLSRSAAAAAATCYPSLDDVERNNLSPAIRVVTRQVYTRVAIHVELDDLAPHPDFVQEVQKALDLPDDEQVHALRDVLRRWGSCVATHVELGCALVNTFVFPLPHHIPSLGLTHDPNPRALLGAETAARNALRTLKSGKAYGADQKERDVYANLADQILYRVVGGSTEMQIGEQVDKTSLEDPDTWAVVGLDGVHSTLDLLRPTHPDLCNQANDLMISTQNLTATSLSPPCLVLPGRLIFSKNGTRDVEHICGYLEPPLPDFDLAANFSVCAWVKSSVTGFSTAAISILCAEHEVVLVIGQWFDHGFFETLRRWPDGSGEPTLVWLEEGSSARVQRGTWQHLTFTQTSAQLSFFLDGRLVKAVTTPKASHAPACQIKLCIGRSSYQNRRVDQWDGEIEDVKLWKRALTKDEVAAEAAGANMPR